MLRQWAGQSSWALGGGFSIAGVAAETADRWRKNAAIAAKAWDGAALPPFGILERHSLALELSFSTYFTQVTFGAHICMDSQQIDPDLLQQFGIRGHGNTEEA